MVQILFILGEERWKERSLATYPPSAYIHRISRQLIPKDSAISCRRAIVVDGSVLQLSVVGGHGAWASKLSAGVRGRYR